MRRIPSPPKRTVAVVARSQSCFSRLRVRYPDATPETAYDAERARELLASTCELPASKSDLLVLLAEYRRAIYSLTKLLANH